MQTLKAKIISILRLRPRHESDDEKKDTSRQLWRMRVSYLGPDTVYEVELRESLKGIASKRYTVGLNGLCEFEMLAEPRPEKKSSCELAVTKSMPSALDACPVEANICLL
jgi:hypothetical protein